MVRTPKIIFRVLQIISRVLQVPIFRNNFCFGCKVLLLVYGVFRNSKNLTFVRVRRHKTLNDAIYTSGVCLVFLQTFFLCPSCIYIFRGCCQIFQFSSLYQPCIYISGVGHIFFQTIFLCPSCIYIFRGCYQIFQFPSLY